MTQAAGSAQDQAPRSLAELADIVLPPEVSMAPAAPGWTVLGAAVSVALLALAAWLVRRHRDLAYRRAALAELARIRSSRQLDALPALLKRTALVAHRRVEVAGLSGPRWTSFLDRTGGTGRFARGAGDALAELAYGGQAGGRATPATDELLDAAEAWIRAQGPALEEAR